MTKTLDALLENIDNKKGYFTYNDESPERLKTNIQTLINNNYVSIQNLNGTYMVQITEAGLQYLASLN